MAKIALHEWEQEWQKIEETDRAVIKNSDLVQRLYDETFHHWPTCRNALIHTYKTGIGRDEWYAAAMKSLKGIPR